MCVYFFLSQTQFIYIFRRSQGFRSGSYMDLEAMTSLAHGIGAFANPLARKKCEPYNVSAVADAVRSMHTLNDLVLSAVSLDMPPTVRLPFTTLLTTTSGQQLVGPTVASITSLRLGMPSLVLLMLACSSLRGSWDSSTKIVSHQDMPFRFARWFQLN